MASSTASMGASTMPKPASLRAPPTSSGGWWWRCREVSRTRSRSFTKRFGADVSNALTAGGEWLITDGYVSVEQPGTITPKRNTLRDLDNSGIPIAAEKMSVQLGMPHHAPFEGT